jgi:UTP-glucose-1-phosphate uridylyltransferase
MKIKVQGLVHWHKYDWDDKPVYQIFPNDMSSCGPEYVPIVSQEFEFDIPDDFDPRPTQVAALREHKKKVLEEAQRKANNIEDQIKRLLAIEFKSGAA